MPPTMVVEAERLPVESLARAAAEVAASSDLRTALGAIARAAADATRADLAVVRVLDADGLFVARAQAPDGSALAAEVAGTRTSGDSVALGIVAGPTLRVARQVRAVGVVAVPARVAGRVVGSLELVRVTGEFEGEALAAADLAASQVALAIRTIAPDSSSTGVRAKWLELAGEALAAGSDAQRAAQQAVRLAVESTGASGGALWRVDAQRAQELIASVGPVEGGLDRAAQLV